MSSSLSSIEQSPEQAYLSVTFDNPLCGQNDTAEFFRRPLLIPGYVFWRSPRASDRPDRDGMVWVRSKLRWQHRLQLPDERALGLLSIRRSISGLKLTR